MIYEQLRRDAERYRSLYKPGDRLVLVKMNDPLDPVAHGIHGTLDHIDDGSQFHMKWDNGRTLPLVPKIDEFRRLTKLEEAEEQRLQEFVAGIINTMKPGHAAQTFVMMDHSHGVNIFVDDSLGEGNWEYVVESCAFDYASGETYGIDVGNGERAFYGDVKGLWRACMVVITTQLPGWEEESNISPVYETDEGITKCGHCGSELICDENGNMPVRCSVCGQEMDYHAYDNPVATAEPAINRNIQYLVQTKHPDGSVTADFMFPSAIIDIFGFRDCTDCEHEVFDVSQFGKIIKIEHEPATSAPFNYHRFVNTETGDTEFEGSSLEH